MLLVLRPVPQGEERRHPFSNAVHRMRECLSNFTAVQFRMSGTSSSAVSWMSSPRTWPHQNG